MQDLLWEQLGQHRTVHFHWAGAYTVEDLPTPLAQPPAQFQPMAIERLPCIGAPSSRRIFPICVPVTMRSRVRRAPARFTSQRLPARTFDFGIGERPINRQDGDVSGARAAAGAILIDREIEFPAGGVRVAPIEASVQGIVVFPRSTWNGERVDDFAICVRGGNDRFPNRRC